jgi:hypothetical protein
MFMKGGVKYMTNDNRIRFTFRIPGALMDALRESAKDHGVSLNALILQVLWEWVEAHERKEPVAGRDKEGA